MALVFADRVREFTATTGTGNITLTGAVPGYRTFNSALSSSDTCKYCIYDSTTNAWEVGVGTLTSPSTLARTTLESSSTGSAIDFTSGTKDVMLILASSKINDIISALSGKAPTSHAHATSDITGFAAAALAAAPAETVTTIKAALGITTLSGANTGDQDLSGKQDLSSKLTSLAALSTTQIFTLGSSNLQTISALTTAQVQSLGASGIAALTTAQIAVLGTPGTSGNVLTSNGIAWTSLASTVGSGPSFLDVLSVTNISGITYNADNTVNVVTYPANSTGVVTSTMGYTSGNLTTVLYKNSSAATLYTETITYTSGNVSAVTWS